MILKGLIVARDYPQPLHREFGDIDLYFERKDGYRAVEVIKQKGITVLKEQIRDISFNYRNFIIEIHPYIVHSIDLNEKKYANRFQLWFEEELKTNGQIIRIGNRNAEITGPSIMLGIIYEFYHLWIHFVKEGVGLRHLCDWCMCLHTGYGKYDIDELRKKLERFGLFRPWIVFSGILVDYLGLPKSEMPFYKKTKKSEILLEIIFQEGNFGKNKAIMPLPKNRLDKIYRKSRDRITRYKLLWRLFPWDIFTFLPSISSIKRNILI